MSDRMGKTTKILDVETAKRAMGEGWMDADCHESHEALRGLVKELADALHGELESQRTSDYADPTHWSVALLAKADLVKR